MATFTPPETLIGREVGHLTLLELVKQGRRRMWRCRCTCGREDLFPQRKLVRPHSRTTCGVCRKGPQTHGHARRRHCTPEYRAWRSMHTRCYNEGHPRYPEWGGRGITICAAWRKFEAFLADMGARPSPKHQLDRIDNDGPYCAANCRWATRSQQSRNRRDRKPITFHGQTQLICEWAEQTSIPQRILYKRIYVHNWEVGRALETPVRR